MKKLLATIALLTLLGSAVFADTLYLKNGSVLKGTFIGYENGEFVFELGSGRRVNFPAGEVSRVALDRDYSGNSGGGSVGNSGSDRGDSGRPILTRRGTERRSPDPSDSDSVDSLPPPERPAERPAERPDRSGSVLSRGGGRSSSSPGSTSSVEVKLEGQWVRSQVQVSRGQRVRVDAGGTIYLDGRTPTGPDGLSGRRDPEAPLPNENDGALIAAIGQDPNSPSILIGRSNEFTADRDGVLYFTVNHWETQGARGAFNVNVSVSRGSGRSESSEASGQQQGARERTITVQSNQPWTDTGIDVEPNMTFEIVAEGQIDLGNRQASGPDGNRDAIVRSANYPLPGEGVGALIGKIRYRNGRDSNLVFIGSRGTPTTEQNEYGRLLLGINDDNLRDNRGSYTVRIRW
ncbi:MAG TPA: hypothetical protein VJ302_21830 [Blastocatellia bacterium]|nr:hypothetical protein [Blastocatellia bacterium]